MRPSTFQTPSGSRPKGSIHALLVLGLVLAAGACTAAPAPDQTPGSSQPSAAPTSPPSASLV
ncbi:MAG: hypothetical protein ACR2LP_01695, partial [Candidatus Limnocylindrales bacterium]